MSLTRVLHGKTDQGPLLILHIASGLRIAIWVDSFLKCALPIYKAHLQFSLHVTWVVATVWICVNRP